MACTDLDSYDFVVRQGFDKVVKFRYLGGGVPVDLTGSTIDFNSSLDIFDQQAVITDNTAGEFEVTFLKEITTALTQRRVKYEVFRTIDGKKTPLFIGSINLTPEEL